MELIEPPPWPASPPAVSPLSGRTDPHPPFERWLGEWFDSGLTDESGLRSPVSGRPLRRTRFFAQEGDRPDAYVLTEGEWEEWPLADQIPFLRVNRGSLCRRVLEEIDEGQVGAAVALLMTDQDDFARGAGPPPVEVRPVADAGDGGIGFRDAMDRLKYDPVAHYFAHRPSTPTFLSGSALLALATPPAGDAPPAGVVELCCGVGHFLRHLAGRLGKHAGTDVVFSKLWLARTFVDPPPHAGRFLCCDVSAAPVPLPDGTGQTVLCHDALYFLPDKRHVLAEMKRLAGPGGTVLVGHAHNSAADHGDVAGTPLTPREYANLFADAGMPGPDLYDDADLAAACLTGARPRAKSADELRDAEAVAAVWPGGGGHWDDALTLPAPGTPLRPNPLLVEADGVLRPDWPMPRFAEEYRSATYLTHEVAADERPVIDAAKHGPVPMSADPVVERLARCRVLLDVPERW